MELPEPAEPGVDWRKSPPLELTPILAASLDAFYEHGYHGTTVRDIARRVGATVPALYYHHENKQEILFALMDAAIDRSSSMTLVAVAEAEGQPVDAFFNGVEALVRFMATSGKVAYLDAEIRCLTSENRETYARKRAVVERLMLACVEEAVASGDFAVSSPRVMSRALLGMIQGIPVWYNPAGALAVDDVVTEYVDIAAHMVGATPEVLGRVRLR
ncbi:TetR/AcrR family transcriptional regulator [Nocardioides campestrisoli]|uniref:TetR/AcrR family transcriptional regulator n=1 Tax=Nocardioides campestrisoli TaxID=2736757 RepID=UPI00163D52CE|nr:TetR/AcrR family transcriptional regulator [Nocardioides campestrisoli]